MDIDTESTPVNTDEERVASLIAVTRAIAAELAKRKNRGAPTSSTRKRKPPTIASVMRQAKRHGLNITSLELRPDGTIVAVLAGTHQTITINPWHKALNDAKRSA